MLSMANQHNRHQNQAQNGPTQEQVVVVMVPFPAQGHLNQLLHLSRLIASYPIQIHYVRSATHNRQAKLRLHGWDPTDAANLHFHSFPIPPFLSPPPNPNASVKFPSHFQPSFDSSLHLREPVKNLMVSLSSTARRIIVIHDSLISSVVQDVIGTRNAESYTFQSVPAFSTFLYLWEAIERPFEVDGEVLKDLPSLEGCITAEFEDLSPPNWTP